MEWFPVTCFCEQKVTQQRFSFQLQLQETYFLILNSPTKAQPSWLKLQLRVLEESDMGVQLQTCELWLKL